MSTNVIQTHTTTGTKDEIDIPPNSVISFVVTEDSTGLDADVEVRLPKNGTFVTEKATVTTGEVFTTVGPISAIRLNITSLGSSTTTNFEITGISR